VTEKRSEHPLFLEFRHKGSDDPWVVLDPAIVRFSPDEQEPAMAYAAKCNTYGGWYEYRVRDPNASVCCYICGHDLFIGRQAVRGTIPVVVSISASGQADFVCNTEKDMTGKGMDIDHNNLDYKEIEGPYICRHCGYALEQS
jgi:hypothetical protein